MKPESRMLWHGQVPVSGISIVDEAVSTRTIDPVVEGLIDTEWQRQLEVAAASGKTYYDGEGYRMNGFEVTADTFELRLAPIAYRVHATMKALHTDPRIADEHLDRQVIVDSLIRTADDVIVLHTVEKVVESETYLVGGSCSRSRTPIHTGEDLAAYALDRVDAVLGVQPGERSLHALIALVQNEIGCVHTIFDVSLSLTATELAARFRPGPTTKALAYIPVAEFPAWVAAASGYMAVMGPICGCPSSVPGAHSVHVCP